MSCLLVTPKVGVCLDANVDLAHDVPAQPQQVVSLASSWLSARFFRALLQVLEVLAGE